MQKRTGALLVVGVCLTAWIVFSMAFGWPAVTAGENAVGQGILPPHAETAPLITDGPVDIIGRRSLDLDGRLHLLGLDDTVRPLVLVFLDIECPISSRYAPYLNDLFRQASQAKLDFYGIISHPQTTPQEARQFREQYAVRYPLLFDSSGDLALALRPKVVPEVFVIDPSDRVVYRGRIDNRFAAIGKLRQTITAHDLRDAITAVAAGDRPTLPTTPGVGCIFEAWSDTRIASVTYTRDIAPILHANCVECHRPGRIGPFALDSYDTAKRRAQMIALVTAERRMPPWYAEPGFGHFQNERRLTQRHIDLLSAWAEAGAPHGQAADALPVLAAHRSDWPLGEPDLVVPLPEAYPVPATGRDVYRYFVVPNVMSQDQHLVAFDFKPGDPTVVHHNITYMDYSGWARIQDEQDEGPGFSLFNNSAGLPRGTQGIGGWAPGSLARYLPPGVGVPLGRGGDLLIEIHYHLNGKHTTDQSAVGLYFAKRRVERSVQTLAMRTLDVDISAGEADYQRHLQLHVPVSMTLFGIQPHMHYVGKAVQAVAILPDGSTLPLLHVPDWDFRWQNIYTFRQPLHIPAGSRIDTWFTYDNSADNSDNPNSPPQRIRWGWQSTDEMCEFYLTAVTDNPRDERRLAAAERASWRRSAEVRKK